MDNTARPRTSHLPHRTLSFRSSTFSRGPRPSRARDAGVSSAVCPHAAQSISTKSPGPRSSILARYSGAIRASTFSVRSGNRSPRVGPQRQPGNQLLPPVFSAGWGDGAIPAPCLVSRSQDVSSTVPPRTRTTPSLGIPHGAALVEVCALIIFV